MASAVHIPESSIHDVKSLLDLARKGTVFVDTEEESFQIIRQRKARTVAEILADPTIKWSGAVPDENFAKDLEDIIAERKLPWRDPWAE
jgi:hypothetical protein